MAISTGAAIIGAAAIGGVASMAASKTQASAARDAAELQRQATDQSVKAQLSMYNQSRADLEPWRQTGVQALYKLADLYGVPRPTSANFSANDNAPVAGPDVTAGGGFEASPGYQFRYNEGLAALDKSAAARGRLHSGGYARELTRYGQGVASQEFDNYANRIASLAGVGQAATNTGVASAGQTGAGIAGATMAGAAGQGNALMAAGTARASGYAGVANAFNGGMQNYLFMQAINKRAA